MKIDRKHFSDNVPTPMKWKQIKFHVLNQIITYWCQTGWLKYFTARLPRRVRCQPILQNWRNLCFFSRICWKAKCCSFTVSCFMNFHHPFMFDNFSPFNSRVPEQCSNLFSWFYEPSQHASDDVGEKNGPPFQSKLNQLQYVREMFQFQWTFCLFIPIE